MSHFGWWARFEDNYGDFSWLDRRYGGREAWRVTEDPDGAYRFGSKKEAEDAIEVFGPMPHGRWEVVEHKDEGVRRGVEQGVAQSDSMTGKDGAEGPGEVSSEIDRRIVDSRSAEHRALSSQVSGSSPGSLFDTTTDPRVHANLRPVWTVSAYLVYANAVLLVFHKRLQMWLPIGGRMLPFERPEDAVIRELIEETGYTREKILRVQHLGYEEHAAGDEWHMNHEHLLVMQDLAMTGFVDGSLRSLVTPPKSDGSWEDCHWVSLRNGILPDPCPDNVRAVIARLESS